MHAEFSLNSEKYEFVTYAYCLLSFSLSYILPVYGHPPVPFLRSSHT